MTLPTDAQVTFTASAQDNLRAMRVNAYARCEALDKQVLARSMAELPEEWAKRCLGALRDNERAKAEVWRNVASSLVDLIGLACNYDGGKVMGDGESLYVACNGGLHFGVNQSSHDGSWSINS